MVEPKDAVGTSGTQWYNLSIEDMWQWVNRDLSPHYKQANSWKKTSELYGLYQSRLQAFRDKLAQAWNPQTSKASEAYLAKLDELILAVKNVDAVAGRNYQASVDIPNAIAEAKYKLKPIYEAYKAAAGDFRGAGGLDSDGTYATPTASASPEQVSAATKMNGQFYAAQTVMFGLSEDLSRSRASLGRPEPYSPPVHGKDDGGDYGGSGMSPPMIPPVVPVGPSPAPTPGPTGPMPAPRGPDLQHLQPVGSSPNPIGYTPPPTTGPTGPGPVPPSGLINPPPTPAGGAKPTIPGGPPAGKVPGGLGGAPPRQGVPGVIGGGTQPSGRPGMAGARPNPPGGVIGGGTPPGGAGRGAPGAAGAAGVGGRGPAAGPGAGGRGVAGAAGAGARGAMGAMGAGGRAGQGHDEDGEHFDPDTAWDVAQGVAPVLDAQEEQRPIDPGPAIGLSR